MATAEDYARWIVQNQDKQGTPDFETVARAYEAAKGAKPAPQRSLGEQVGRQVGLTARAGVEGLAGLAGIVADPATALLNMALPQSAQIPVGVQGAASNLLTMAGVPQPENGVERVVQAAAQSMAGGAGMAGVGKLIAGGAAPLAQAVGQQLAAQPLQQVAGAAGAGLGGQTAQEAGVGPVGQVAAALAGGVAGAGAAGAATAKRGVVRPDVAAAEKLGIPVLTSDVRQPTTFAGKFAQSAGEKIPVAGTGPVRAQQQAARVDAVRNVLREFGADDAAAASDGVMADLAKKRGADLQKYKGLKTEVIERLSPSGPVNVDRALSAIDKQVARLESLRTEDAAKVAAKLTDWRNALPEQDLSNIELLRKQIGDSFKASELAGVRSTGEEALSSIYGPLREDMGAHIKAFGDRRDFAKWSTANARLSEMSGELKNGALKSALSRGTETPEVVKSLLFSQKPSDARALYRNLTPAGRANARMAILAKAADDAGGMEQLSPEKFTNSVKKLGASVGVFFHGDEKARLDGLTRALKLTRHAADANINPQTGASLAIPVGAAALADVLGSGGAAIASGAAIGGLSRVYESAPVRNALLRLSASTPGSAEEAAIFKRVSAAIQAANQEGEQ